VGIQYDRFEAASAVDAQRMLNAAVGAAALPLWTAFYASATAASAFWWTAAWTRGELNVQPRALLLDFDAHQAFHEVEDEVCEVVEAVHEAVADAIEESLDFAGDVAAAPIVDAYEAVEAEAGIEPAAEPAPEVQSTIETVEAPQTLEAPQTEVAAEPLAGAEVAELPAAKGSRKKAAKAD